MQTRPRHPVRTSLAEVRQWLAERSEGELAAALRASGGDDPTVTGLSLSTARVRAGDLYAALPGAHRHGAEFAAPAVEAGACAILTDPAGAALVARDGAGAGVPVLVVERPRALLGALAARLAGEPTSRLRLIGVTGTQGKTTTTRLAEAALAGAGVRAAVVGTIGTRIAGHDVATALTTPEAPDLQALFAVMVEEQVGVCAMEVSSHALVLGRVDGVLFDVAVFLNLGRDHLDFHRDLEDYFAAKASLFTPERARRAVICIDDEFGRRLAADTRIPAVTFSWRGTTDGHTPDWWVEDVVATRGGSRFTVCGPGGVRAPSEVALPGDFNVGNAAAALVAAAQAGYDPVVVGAALARTGGVPGRLERVSEPDADVLVVIDYAHKPDAVQAALDTLRPLAAEAQGRVLVVLGAGGDRDPGKRPLMGALAARLADVVVVTDDNPRSEDPAAIRAAVLAGAAAEPDARAEVHEVGDRRAAIATALDLARPGDVVLVAGKGHETGQEVAGVVHPFDDRTVARTLLAQREDQEVHP